MARINNRTEEDILDGRDASIDDAIVEFDDFREKIETLSQDSGACMKARIYRVEKPSNRKIYVGNYEGGFVYEEHVAENYGGGSYVVFYTWRNTKTGKMERSSSTMSIDENFGRPRESSRYATPSSKGVFGNILEHLTTDKVAVGVAMVEGIKKIFAPSIDYTKMFEIMAAPRSPSVSDAVMVKMLEGIQQNGNAARASISDQLEDLKNLKDLAGEIVTPKSDKDNGGDTMDMMIKIGLPMLAEIIKSKGGNMRAAGESVRGNVMVDSMIAGNPALATEFFNAVAKQYGDEAAKQLADGYGYQVNRAQDTTPAIAAPEEKKEKKTKTTKKN